MIRDFFLFGHEVRQTCQKIDVDHTDDLDALRLKVAAQFNVIEPQGINFQNNASGDLPDIEAVLDSEEPVGILVDGHQVREPVSITAPNYLLEHR